MILVDSFGSLNGGLEGERGVVDVGARGDRWGDGADEGDGQMRWNKWLGV